MNDAWELANLWPVRALVAGATVLLVGRLLLCMTRQPARRVWIGTAAVVAALLAIPFSFVPGWVHVTVPAGEVAATPVAEVPPPVPETTLAVVEVPLEAPVGVPPLGGFEPAPPEGGTPAPVDQPTSTALESASQPTHPATATPATNWTTLVGWGYGLVVAALLLRLGAGHIALARLWRKACPAPAWAEAAFRQLAGPVCPRAQLRVSARPVGPVCFGVVRPRVLIPAGLLMSGDGPALRAMFAHELAHLGRRDPLAGWLVGLARAAYFLCPWVAGLRREIRLAQECLADADAAGQAAVPADYAELLIRLARSRPAPLGAAGVRGPSSELYRRVSMLLQRTDGVERRCPPRWALAAGVSLTAVAVVAAGLSIQPRPAIAAVPEKKEPAKTEGEKKEPAKAEPRPDPLKDALEKLKKDIKDDPAAVRALEELLKEAQRPIPLPPGANGKVPPRGAIPRVPLAPGIDPLDPDKELEEILRQQLEMLTKQLQLGGIRGGGIVVGPDGAVQPIPGFGGNRFGMNRGGGRLGVRVERPTEVLSSQLELPPGQGLVCIDVPAESVAGKAGIKPNDILLELGGKSVSSNFPDFQRVLNDVKPDAAVDIVVMRKGKKETIKGVKLPEAKPIADFPAIPEFPAVPFPPLPPIVGAPDLVPPPGGRGGVVVGPGETARVEQVNDAFTVFYTKGNVKVTIAGTKEGGTAKAESIEVEADGKTHKAESIDKLPKEYQEMAKNALKAVK